MDYSTSINDVDNPAGPSPWGSSPVASPRHARDSSFGASSHPPESPTPYSTGQSGNGSYSRPESSAGTDTGTESVTESDVHSRPDTAPSTQSASDQQFAPAQPAQPQQRQSQHPQGPQYKLQAKITGLERTGRKDPILRFDVHVSWLYPVEPL